MSTPAGPKLVSAIGLHEFAIRVFETNGASNHNARIVADHLVEASLRGVDSHGVVRIPVYVQGIRDGEIDPKASPQVVRETASSAVVDGNKGFGQVAALCATEVAARKARTSGSSGVAARNLSHVGVLGYYGAILAREGLIGQAYTSGFPRVAPWGGKGKLLGTNPICYAFPVKGSDPIVIDVATTAVAGFKVIQAAKEGKPIPEGWAMDPEGAPTTDAKVAMEGSLMPMAGHKGYGLAVSAEILSRVLGGNRLRQVTKEVAYTQGGFFIEAFYPGAFREEAEYYADVAELVAKIKATPPARGFEKVMLPGEPETISKAKRSKDGIPVAQTTWKEFEQVSVETAVPLPE